MWPKPARKASVVAEELRERILKLYDRFLSADGKAVDYEGLSTSPFFDEYIDASAELQRVEVFDLSRYNIIV